MSERIYVRAVNGEGQACRCGKRSALHVGRGNVMDGTVSHFLCAECSLRAVESFTAEVCPDCGAKWPYATTPCPACGLTIEAVAERAARSARAAPVIPPDVPYEGGEAKSIPVGFCSCGWQLDHMGECPNCHTD